MTRELRIDRAVASSGADAKRAGAADAETLTSHVPSPAFSRSTTCVTASAFTRLPATVSIHRSTAFPLVLGGFTAFSSAPYVCGGSVLLPHSGYEKGAFRPLISEALLFL